MGCRLCNGNVIPLKFAALFLFRNIDKSRIGMSKIDYIKANLNNGWIKKVLDLSFKLIGVEYKIKYGYSPDHPDRVVIEIWEKADD